MLVQSGTKAALPTLPNDTLYICSDTNEIYCGTERGNVQVTATRQKTLIIKVTQASTDAPVVTTILDEFGVTLTPARSDTGEYAITISPSISDDNDKCEIYVVKNTSSAAWLNATVSGTSISWSTYNALGAVDGETDVTLKVIVRDV